MPAADVGDAGGHTVLCGRTCFGHRVLVEWAVDAAVLVRSVLTVSSSSVRPVPPLNGRPEVVVDALMGKIGL